LGAAAAVALLMMRRSPSTVAASVPILFGWTLFALHDGVLKGGLLQTQYYVSWLLVPAFVAIGVATARVSAMPVTRRALSGIVVMCTLNWLIAPRLPFHTDSLSGVQFDLVQQTIRLVSMRVPLERGRPIFWFERGPAFPFASSIVSTHLFLYSLA